ncbi:hypothetical protein D5R81_01915 [Parashewanella spongiae]|uniref:Uncharacterized protein n=1 Tax=Parashewanella spongiae TaxID=342950 RepID=A0A3A6TSI3_9GAMM|nr:hypothetical protein D5R81_01915 [Parashewanella spongiae]
MTKLHGLRHEQINAQIAQNLILKDKQPLVFIGINEDWILTIDILAAIHALLLVNFSAYMKAPKQFI